MKAALARLMVAALGALPLQVNRRVGAVGGWLVWALRLRARRFTETNLTLAFPDLSAEQHRALVRRSLIETGCASTETAWLWRRPLAETVARMNNDSSAHVIEESRKTGRGILLVTPHTGSWEATMPAVISEGEKMAYFYRKPRQIALDPILIDGRANVGGTALRLDASGIRDAMKRLKDGDVVGLLPDQEPDRDGGVFAPFFGTPALTMTLLARLARKTGSDVLFVVVIRTRTGWHSHVIRPNDSIMDSDPVIAATAVNEAVERCVALAPEQYLWSYRRYRELPEGGRRHY